MKYFFLLFLFSFNYLSAQSDEKVNRNLSLVDSIYQQDYEKAIELLSSLLDENFTELRYFEKLIDIYIENELYEVALGYHDIIIDLDPENPRRYTDRAILLKQLHRFKLSILDYTKALNLSAGDDTLTGELYNDRGTSKIQLRDFEGAYRDISRSISYDSTQIHRLSNFAGVLMQMKKYEEAKITLEKVIQLDSLFSGGYANLGFLYNETENYTLAIEYFNKAIQAEPTEGTSYNNRGFAKYKLGLFDEALKDINQSLVLYPTNAYAYKNRALVFFELKEEKKACGDLNTAKNLDFTRMYGNEVEILIKEKCRKS